MGKLEGPGGNTEGIGSEKGFRRVISVETQSPQCSSGVSEARYQDSAEGSGEFADPPAPGSLAASLGQRVPDALEIPSRCWRRGTGFPGEDLTLGYQISLGAFSYLRWRSRSASPSGSGNCWQPRRKSCF